MKNKIFIEVSKNEFQMLMDVLGEGLSTIMLKELQNQNIPQSFNKIKFIKMIDKIIKQSHEQGIELENKPNLNTQATQEELEAINDFINLYFTD